MMMMMMLCKVRSSHNLVFSFFPSVTKCPSSKVKYASGFRLLEEKEKKNIIGIEVCTYTRKSLKIQTSSMLPDLPSRYIPADKR